MDVAYYTLSHPDITVTIKKINLMIILMSGGNKITAMRTFQSSVKLFLFINVNSYNKALNSINDDVTRFDSVFTFPLLCIFCVKPQSHPPPLLCILCVKPQSLPI